MLREPESIASPPSAFRSLSDDHHRGARFGVVNSSSESSQALRRAALVLGDLLAAVGIVLCIPLVVLAIGTPIVLCVGLLLRLVAML